MSKVYVVMSNDYPDCVFADESAADRYIEAKNTEQKKDLKPYMMPRIYYRAYEFEVK